MNERRTEFMRKKDGLKHEKCSIMKEEGQGTAVERRSCERGRRGLSKRQETGMFLSSSLAENFCFPKVELVVVAIWSCNPFLSP